MIVPGERSKWTFDTSSGFSALIDVVAVETGTFILDRPDGRAVSFNYNGGGLGVGDRFRNVPHPAIPLGGGKSASGLGSSEQNDSRGVVWKTRDFQRPELELDDFIGPCLFIEGGLSMFAGVTGSVMALGVNGAQTRSWAKILERAVMPIAGPVAGISMQLLYTINANAVLGSASVNAGIQGGIGGAVYVGNVTYGGLHNEPPRAGTKRSREQITGELSRLGGVNPNTGIRNW